MTASAPVLSLQHVAKTFHQGSQPVPVLSDVNLAVQAGETVAILGQSGSGKSTLLSLIAGLDVPSSGEVRLADRDLRSFTETELTTFRARTLAIVFQQFHLMTHLSALENVALPLELRGEREANDLAKAALDSVGLSHRLTHFPAQLSGGERQRVAIARAFVIQPSLLLADEPSGNLDAETGEQVMGLLFERAARLGTTLLLVTHNDELARRCQRRLLLKNGTLQTAS